MIPARRRILLSWAIAFSLAVFVNNLSYCLFSRIERDASAPLSYITGLYVDLTYEANGKTGMVRVRDGVLGFVFGKLKCKFIVYKPEQAIQIGEELQEYVDYASVNFKHTERNSQSILLYDSY